MRRIQTGDVFKMARIIKALSIREELTKIAVDARKEDGSTDIEAVGIKAFMMVMESCADATVENKIYDLLAGITEKNVEDIKTQTLDATIHDIREIVKENDIVNFSKSAVQLTQ